MNSLSHEARAMNAVERLEAAIEKLETLKGDAGIPETCRDCRDKLPMGERVPAAEFVLWGKMFDRAAFGPKCWNHAYRWFPIDWVDQWPVYDLRPVVTLHRTIDAQLAILRDAVEFGATFGYGTSGARSAQIDHWFDLADAILGES